MENNKPKNKRTVLISQNGSTQHYEEKLFKAFSMINRVGKFLFIFFKDIFLGHICLVSMVGKYQHHIKVKVKTFLICGVGKM
jgi:hypothetical protein